MDPKGLGRMDFVPVPNNFCFDIYLFLFLLKCGHSLKLVLPICPLISDLYLVSLLPLYNSP